MGLRQKKLKQSLSANKHHYIKQKRTYWKNELENVGERVVAMLPKKEFGLRQCSIAGKDPMQRQKSWKKSANSVRRR